MNIKERQADIQKHHSFSENEIEKYDGEKENTFKSIEYYIIFHYTNEELFYLSAEEYKNLNELKDLKISTKKGIYFCFK